MNVIDSFEALALAAPIQRALRDKNYTTPSPIQAQAIPPLLEGHDLLGSAQTGTGKTAAFALPILQKLHDHPQPLVRGRAQALVLTPTRELAIQVGQSFKEYGRHMKVNHCLVYGGVAAGPQIRTLRKGVDVLVATPGRLMDLHSQGHIDLSCVQFLVLDEADRMLDMGFINDIRKIVKLLPEKRQSLFFSATLSPEITQLADTILTNPVQVRIAPEQPTAEKVDHRICFLRHGDKNSLLIAKLRLQREAKTKSLSLVFTRTKHGADKLARILDKAGIRSAAIHGNKSQGARQRALEDFRTGKRAVLIATDVAARGLDVKGITLVINYDLPDEPESYVHRIGRTARAGADGQAFSFCTENSLKELVAIERLLKASIDIFQEHEFHDKGIANRHRDARKSRSGGSGRSKGRSFKPKASNQQRRRKSRPNNGKKAPAFAKR